MKINYTSLVSLAFVIILCKSSYAQAEGERISQILPALTKPINCELALTYIDDALVKANSNKSNLIMIINKRKMTNVELARTRANNLKKYLRFRGFENFKVAVDFDFDGTGMEQIEIFVSGQSLYSLPIAPKDKLDLSVCVVGPKL